MKKIGLLMLLVVLLLVTASLAAAPVVGANGLALEISHRETKTIVKEEVVDPFDESMAVLSAGPTIRQAPGRTIHACEVSSRLDPCGGQRAIAGFS